MGKVIKFKDNESMYISEVDRIKRRALNIIEKLVDEKYHLIQENQRLKERIIRKEVNNIEKEETSNVNSKY